MIDGQVMTDGMTLDISARVMAADPAGHSLRLVWDTPGAPRENAPLPGDVYVGFWQLPF